MVYDIAKGTYILFTTINKSIYLDQAREDFTFDNDNNPSTGQFMRLTNPVDTLNKSTQDEALKWICEEWGLEPTLKLLLIDSDVHILTETFEW